MKKLLLVLSMLCVGSCLVGCDKKHDSIEVFNESRWRFDNVDIDIKEGYFYDYYETFAINDDTVAVTIYFSKERADTWDEVKEK